MSNKNKIYKLISVALVAPMVLGISNQTFENLKVFASSGEQGKTVIGESEDSFPEVILEALMNKALDRAKEEIRKEFGASEKESNRSVKEKLKFEIKSAIESF